ncbi:MAG: hypothetical protein IPK82_27665 [Polyangiaceae bacterium]|nr:hypothetical protein [Polyangiaceae bacterium]
MFASKLNGSYSPWIIPMSALFCAFAALGCDESPGGEGGGGAGGTGGQTSTGPKCVGDPKPCEGRSSFDCVGFLGCNDGGACTGTVAACGTMTDENACVTHYGCVWSPSKALCEGTPAPCSMVATVEMCTTQAGCSWQADECGGYPYDCETFETEGICYGQPGCDWKVAP